MNNYLIESCICGVELYFDHTTINDIPVKVCKNCGTIHQELKNFTSQDLVDFYQYQYHLAYQAKKGVISYYDRYEHDCKVADLRLTDYSFLLSRGMKGLDVGSSNSAFVHRANVQGLVCEGLEIGDSIGDDTVTIRGNLETADLKRDHYDFVTMHDSIEHMIDPRRALLKVQTILKSKGVLIVDLPDFFIEEGKHHWKRVEHLWFFTREQFIKLLEVSGFTLIRVTTPIPGKLVFYAVSQ